ncbi:MAG: hypothetical protein WD795_17615 [Woeseia sp.]
MTEDTDETAELVLMSTVQLKRLLKPGEDVAEAVAEVEIKVPAADPKKDSGGGFDPYNRG